MPSLTRWYVRTSLLYLVAALIVAVVMQGAFAARIPLLGVLWPTYLHMLIVGWITQLIFGVAYWLFPRYSAEQPRGSERLGWISYALLNAGLLLRIVGEPWRALGGSVGWILVGSALLQLGAGWAFVANTWVRVKER